jgi:hypothetical protein
VSKAKSDIFLILAAAACGPHATYRAAIMALRKHRDIRIAKLANECTAESLENRLRKYQGEMKGRHPPDPDFMSPVARAALRLAVLAGPHLPDDDPDINNAAIELLRRISEET